MRVAFAHYAMFLMQFYEMFDMDYLQTTEMTLYIVFEKKSNPLYTLS